MRLNDLGWGASMEQSWQMHIDQRTCVYGLLVELTAASRKGPHLARAELVLPGLERGRHELGGDDHEEQLCMLHHLCRVPCGPHAFRALIALQSKLGTCLVGVKSPLYGATTFVILSQLWLGWACWRSPGPAFWAPARISVPQAPEHGWQLPEPPIGGLRQCRLACIRALVAAQAPLPGPASARWACRCCCGAGAAVVQAQWLTCT